MAGKGGLKVEPKIIVIRPRKKARGGGHHGGSWKVAYADFVTAMMAFFMVMWIVSMDEGVKDVVEGYFNDPIGFRRGYATGNSPAFPGSGPTMSRPTPVATLQRSGGDPLESAARNIREGVEGLGLQGVEADIAVSVTEDGLRVELAEGQDGETFFSVGSAQAEPALQRVLAVVLESLEGMPNRIVLEGHTDATPYPRAGYTNWELSVDRANAARRLLVAAGLDESRILEVRGYADRRLRYADEPRNPGNRRVTLFVAGEAAGDTPAVAGTTPPSGG